MTPKEKAKELVEKLRKATLRENLIDAKKCALICVDEILECTLGQLTMEMCKINHILLGRQTTSDYWKEVKQEIELLKQ